MAKEQADLLPTIDRTGDDALRCASCGHEISDSTARVERGGAHAHTFVNPHGIAHHIGCFLVAPGCHDVGAIETAFSWFPGWSWQVSVCGRCHTHLGWKFSLAAESFYGLILANLREG